MTHCQYFLKMSLEFTHNLFVSIRNTNSRHMTSLVATKSEGFVFGKHKNGQDFCGILLYLHTHILAL